jgi:hypothetical protein
MPLPWRGVKAAKRVFTGRWGVVWRRKDGGRSGCVRGPPRLQAAQPPGVGNLPNAAGRGLGQCASLEVPHKGRLPVVCRKHHHSSARPGWPSAGIADGLRTLLATSLSAGRCGPVGARRKVRGWPGTPASTVSSPGRPMLAPWRSAPLQRAVSDHPPRLKRGARMTHGRAGHVVARPVIPLLRAT